MSRVVPPGGESAVRNRVVPMTFSQLEAAISLLDDRSSEVVESCTRRLFDAGEAALAALESVPDRHGRRRERALAVARRIRTRLAERRFLDFVGPADRVVDLEDGVFLLSRILDPEFDDAPYRDQLDAFAAEIASSHPDRSDEAAVAEQFRRTLVDRGRLRGDREDYYDHQNSFVHRVLDRRRGIPISLSAIYLFVARRAGLPLYGVGMPGHFVVQCGDSGKTIIDPFSDGRRLTREECLRFLERGGFGANETFLRVTSDRRILIRMIANLVHSFRREENAEGEARFSRLFEAVSGEPSPA